jgi:hypothetical protein
MGRMIVVMLVAAMLGVVGLGSPGAAAQGGQLVSVEIARDQLPAGDGIAVIGRETFAPGSSQMCACPDEQGTVIIVVESGSFTYQIESSAGRIIRGANSEAPREEAAPVSTPFMLDAGDAVVFPGKHRIESNDGTEPATYVFALLLAPAAPPAVDATGEISQIFGVVPGTWPDFGSETVTVTIATADLAPGESLAAPEGGLQFVVQTVAAEVATPTSLAVGGDGGTTNQSGTPLPVVVVSVESHIGAATPEA